EQHNLFVAISAPKLASICTKLHRACVGHLPGHKEGQKSPLRSINDLEVADEPQDADLYRYREIIWHHTEGLGHAASGFVSQNSHNLLLQYPILEHTANFHVPVVQGADIVGNEIRRIVHHAIVGSQDSCWPCF